mmetsp:Transcript_104587/g.144713  ORF Transcript_104587/g.144713 Transcript_104587/m.144713 type:complete len:112 (+) Transcript_104587:167-502(+)
MSAKSLPLVHGLALYHPLETVQGQVPLTVLRYVGEDGLGWLPTEPFAQHPRESSHVYAAIVVHVQVLERFADHIIAMKQLSPHGGCKKFAILYLAVAIGVQALEDETAFFR